MSIFSPTNLSFGIKCMQLLPNGLVGAFMSLDFLHKQVQRDFAAKSRYPAWVPTTLGLCRLTQAALNWIAGGAYVPAAQLLFSFQLGVAACAHMLLDDNTPTALAAPTVFFAGSLTLQYLTGAMPWPNILILHPALAAVGFPLAVFMTALSPEKACVLALSPLSWRAAALDPKHFSKRPF